MVITMTMTRKATSAIAATACILAVGLCGGAQPAWGQGRTFGTYAATVRIAGTEVDGETRRVVYRAEVKMNIPVNDGNPSRAIISIDDVGEPSAKVTITQWDLEERNTSPNADGQITSWKCQLAAPVTVPMLATGVLNLDYRKRIYSMFVSLSGVEEAPLRCVNSRSGPYTKGESLLFFFGTTELDTIPHDALPLSDPARISAKFRLVPKGAMKGQFLPQDQEWELVLKK